MEKNRTLADGPIFSSLIRFAVPVLLTLFLQALYGGVDLLVVGQFAHTADVSGVATGSMLLQTVTMVITGLTMGITILVGEKIGQRDRRAAGQAIGSGICLFAIFALFLTAVLVAGAGPLARLLHAPEEAMGQTMTYIRICGAGAVFIVAYNVLGAVFRGIGDSKTPLLTVCIACVVNIVGDLVLVAGFHMGTAGAAIATVAAQAISVLVSLAVIARRPSLPFDFSRDFVRFHGRTIRMEVQLGAPVALQELLVGASFLVIQTIVNAFGVVPSAGVGVAEKVCSFIMLVPSAYMQSMSAGRGPAAPGQAGPGLRHRNRPGRGRGARRLHLLPRRPARGHLLERRRCRRPGAQLSQGIRHRLRAHALPVLLHRLF